MADLATVPTLPRCKCYSALDRPELFYIIPQKEIPAIC